MTQFQAYVGYRSHESMSPEINVSHIVNNLSRRESYTKFRWCRSYYTDDYWTKAIQEMSAVSSNPVKDPNKQSFWKKESNVPGRCLNIFIFSSIYSHVITACSSGSSGLRTKENNNLPLMVWIGQIRKEKQAILWVIFSECMVNVSITIKRYVLHQYLHQSQSSVINRLIN